MDWGTAQMAGHARSGNRRRLLVFALTFVAALLIGMAWNFLRPAEYRASTRLQVALPGATGPAAAASSAFASRLELVTSRPLLEQLAGSLAAQGRPLPDGNGDLASSLQAMLSVTAVPGTDVLLIEAIGPDPARLADILNALPDVLRADLAARQASEADGQLAAAHEELARLERTSSERQAQLEAFRQRTGVISEREENDSVIRSRGLNQALNTALEKEAAATAQLRAIEAAAAAGETSTQVRNDPTLNALLSRASQAREDLQDMERSYTPEFLAMEPRARALRARLEELERQIAQQRAASLAAALQSARQDLSSAQATVQRLRDRLASARPALTHTSARIAEAKSLEDDLEQVDKARREALERVSRLEANGLRSVATVNVIEPAALPAEPFRPDRGRGAAYVVAGAFVLALLALGMVELFNLSPAAAPAAPATIVLTPGWDAGRRGLPPAGDRLALVPQAGDADPAAPALAAPVHVLDQPQAAALLAAAQGTARWATALALMGLSLPEMTALRRHDLQDGRLHVGGSWARELPLPDWLARDLAAARPDDQPLLHDAAGQPLPPDELAPMWVGAALDAGLPRAAEVDAELLRQTCIDWLVGQGMRFAELSRWVGPVDSGRLMAFAARHEGVPKVDGAAVRFLMPALQLAPPERGPQARLQA